MESNAGKLLTAFLAILIGVILLVVISNEIVSTTGTTAASESYSISTARTGATKLSVLETTQFPLGQRPYASGISVANGSGTVMTSGNYTLVDGGQDGYSYITLLNGTFWEAQIGPKGNTTTISYNYYKLRDSWSRTVLNLSPGFIAMAIMGVGIALLYSMYKENL